MTRDQWLRAYHQQAGSWPALVGIYLVLIGTMVLSASMIV